MKCDYAWILAPISEKLLESWGEAMDVDSSMAPESDHDPAVQNHTSSHAPAAMEREQLGEQPSSGSGSPESPVQQQQQQAAAQVPQSPVVGPRLAPTYTVVNAICEKEEDGPGPRCGHTLTAVAAVGEEGTPGYIGPRLILFGGATALEGNSAAAGTPSSAGNAGIRMCFIYQLSYCIFLRSSKVTERFWIIKNLSSVTFKY